MNTLKLEFRDDPKSGGCKCSPSEAVAIHCGYTIRVRYFEGAPNPFEDDEAQPALIVVSNGPAKTYGIDFEVPELTRDEIRRHATAIAQELGRSFDCADLIEPPRLTPEIVERYRFAIACMVGRKGPLMTNMDDIDAINSEFAAAWRRRSMHDRIEMLSSVYAWQGREPTLLSALGRFRRDDWNDAEGAVNAAIENRFEGLCETDKLDLLAKVYSWKGRPAISTARHGYSQGDWAELLVVAPPGWLDGNGEANDCIEESVKNRAQQLGGAWRRRGCRPASRHPPRTVWAR